MLHALNRKRISKREKEELIQDFKFKCKKMEEFVRNIPEFKRQYCSMWSFNNVWWALAEIPYECIEACIPWLKLLPQGLERLFNQILSLPPSSSKIKKFKMLHQYVAFGCDPLGYIARSDDTKLLDVFIQKLYQGNWTRISDEILSSLLFEAIRNTRYKMVKHIFKHTVDRDVDWEASKCENPRLIFTDFETISFLENIPVTEMVRKKLGVSKHEFSLKDANSPEMIEYILDDRKKNPQLQEAIQEWKKNNQSLWNKIKHNFTVRHRRANSQN